MKISRQEIIQGLDFIIQVGKTCNKTREDWYETRQQFFGVRRFFYDMDHNSSKIIDELSEKYLDKIVDGIMSIPYESK